MQIVKKYAAILFILAVFPIAQFIANNFVLEEGNEIYAYIPQDSDFVIEINVQNFATELAYQRIFSENYFKEKVYPKEEEDVKNRQVKTGIDLFSKVVLFREQWANETIWIAILKYADKKELQKFISSRVPDAQFQFNQKYAIVQLSPSSSQKKLDEHLKKISAKEIKSFNERVNLADIFDPKKEINCFIIPKTRPDNALIEGYLSFDFLKDHIQIEGAFTPIPSFNETEPIAYAVDKNKAFSLRSSLNLFNSIYLFNQEKLENVPAYSQMAFDYNGIDCQMVDRKLGFSTPFISFPKINLHFDILDKTPWYAYFDSLQMNKDIMVDTTKKTFITSQGAMFSYVLNDNAFELSQDSVSFTQSVDSNLYFDLYMEIDPLLNNTTFEVNKKNPPSKIEQSLGLMVANELMNQIRQMANIEWIEFNLEKTKEDEITATGRIEMKEKNGHAMVESLAFGISALVFVKDY